MVTEPPLPASPPLATPRPALPRRVWQVLPRASRADLEALGGPPLIAQLLFNRGAKTRADAERFLHPSLSSGDPFLLPGAEAAVRRLFQAVTHQERIGIFGDFDADGITASAVLTEGLRALGAKIVPYIPDRVLEGHGLNLPAIHHLHAAGVSLIVTADCGISSRPEVAAAADLGIDTIITDHHLPPIRLPEAVALVNPKIALAEPMYSDLASVGVASRLIDALYAEMGRKADETLLEFVALGTVADLAPMRGPVNRSLVRNGLAQLNSTRRPGIQELLKVAHVRPGQVDTEVIAYALGPRLNAPGRVDSATPSYHLLVARSTEEAAPLAAELDLRNGERQKITKVILERVKAELGFPLPPILILGSPDFQPGVVGLAAGKLTEEYNRPSIVCQVGPEETRGSCRSIPQFNIVEALRQCEDLFTRYGGHAQAAGFSMPSRNFLRLKERLLKISAAALGTQSLESRLVIDAELVMDHINGEIIRGLQDFAPHGPQNPVPSFLSRSVEVREARAMGSEGQHMRLRLRSRTVTWEAVAFNLAGERPTAGSLVDLVYTLGVDHWGGDSRLQMRVLDMLPSP